MSDERDFDRIARAWLELGTNEAPDRAVSAVLQAVETTPQVRPLSTRLPWRYEPVNRMPIAAALVVALVIVVGGLYFMRSDGSTNVGGPSPSASALASAPASPALSPTSSASAALPESIVVTPVAVIAVPDAVSIASDGQAAWVLSSSGGLVRIDPGTNEADPPVALDGTAYLYTGVSADATDVWATRVSPGLVYRLDPTTSKVTATIETDEAKGVLAALDAVWVAKDGGTVARIDPGINEVVATVTVGSTSSAPFRMESGFESVWVGVMGDGTVVRIDPSSNTSQATIEMPPSTKPCILLTGPDAVWNIGCDRSTSVDRIDPSTNTIVGSVDLGGFGYSAALIDGAPWVSVESPSGGTMVRIDSTTNQVDRVLSPETEFSGYGEGMVVAAGSVWVVDITNNKVLRLPLSAFES